MGYYFDWVNDEWLELTTKRRHPRHAANKQLLPKLMEAIEKGDSDCKLYAGLLCRAIVCSDVLLMDEFGKQVAKLTGEKVS
jgi:hypothetical protein